jgi:hypothetical protein
MRTIVVLATAMLCATAAWGQSSNPPPKGPVMYGGKPLVQVKPKPKDTTARAVPRDGKPQSTAVRLQGCLDIDDGSKDRLNCYDGIYPPKPNPKAAAAKGVADCRFKKEEDERLGCYNDFAERIPKLPKS